MNGSSEEGGPARGDRRPVDPVGPLVEVWEAAAPALLFGLVMVVNAILAIGLIELLGSVLG